MPEMTQESDDSDRDALDNEYTMKVTSQGKYFLEIPAIHWEAAGFEPGETVGIKPMNFQGRYCLEIVPEDEAAVTRKLRESRYDVDKLLLTIPRRIAMTARLGEAPVTYRSEAGTIVAAIETLPVLDGAVEVYNVTDVFMPKWKGGFHPFQIPRNLHNRDPEAASQPPSQANTVLNLGDSVWFWHDVLGDMFVFGIDVDEDTAPEGSIELQVQESNGSDESDHHVLIPKQVAEAFEISATTMKWGHDGIRMLGQVQSP